MPRSGWAYTDLGYFNELGGMTGSVQFRTDCNSLSGSTNFVYASSSNRIGIREDLTQPGFDIQRGSTALPLYHPNAALEVRGDMNVTGSIYATNYYIKSVSSIEVDGDTKFGDSTDDTHQFYGSMLGIATAVAHGCTNVAPTNAYGNFGPIHTTLGGLMINGISDQESADARSLALRGISNDTHTDTVPLVEIIGAKRSGTSVQALDASETVLQVANHTTTLVTVLGSGNLGIGTTSPDNPLELLSATTPQLRITHTDATDYATFAVDSDGQLDITTVDGTGTGGHICLMPDGNVGVGTTSPQDKLEVKDGRILLTDADVAHGCTNVAPTNAYGDFGPIHATYGGLMINGVSDQESAGARSLALRGISNDTHTDTVPLVEIIGAKRSGTSIQALAAAETVLQVANHTTELVTVLGSGNVGIGVTDPDTLLEVFSTSTQQKWSYDADSYATVAVAASSHTTLATGEQGNLTLDAAADIILDADGDQISMKFGGATGQIDFSNANSGDGIIRQMVDAKDLVIQQYDGTEVVRFGDDRKLYFYDKGGEYLNSDGTNLTIASGNDIVCSIPANSAFEPSLNNVSDLGSASKRWANVYTGDLHLKNDRGDWTVVEESEYLTLVNNANGKKYKIMMEEIED